MDWMADLIGGHIEAARQDGMPELAACLEQLQRAYVQFKTVDETVERRCDPILAAEGLELGRTDANLPAADPATDKPPKFDSTYGLTLEGDNVVVYPYSTPPPNSIVSRRIDTGARVGEDGCSYRHSGMGGSGTVIERELAYNPETCESLVEVIYIPAE